jgi:hypothetical protein
LSSDDILKGELIIAKEALQGTYDAQLWIFVIENVLKFLMERVR